MSPRDAMANRTPSDSFREYILSHAVEFLGSTEWERRPMFVYDTAASKMTENENAQYVPALLAVFDGLLLYVAGRENVNGICVAIDPDRNEISIAATTTTTTTTNMTSNNYEQRISQAKLCNIFSTHFIFESVLGGRKSTKSWHRNLTVADAAQCIASEDSDGFKFTFSPDLQRFNMVRLDDNDTADLMKRRLYDLAGTNRRLSTIKLNGEKIRIANFEEYAKLYVGENAYAFEQSNGWQVAVARSHGKFRHMSFVNDIATHDGGQHVSHVANLIAKKVSNRIKERRTLYVDFVHRNTKSIKNRMMVFVNVPQMPKAIVAGDSLQTRPLAFGSKCDLSERFINGVAKIYALPESEAILANIVVAKDSDDDDEEEKSIRELTQEEKNALQPLQLTSMRYSNVFFGSNIVLHIKDGGHIGVGLTLSHKCTKCNDVFRTKRILNNHMKKCETDL